jgi:hypothetical protein
MAPQPKPPSPLLGPLFTKVEACATGATYSYSSSLSSITHQYVMQSSTISIVDTIFDVSPFI